ncbi:MAG TPA: S4 domain-containing protein [Candidatus Paceibacterota bacterium]|jgi:23S rRNA pseudouridine2604 synthase|nr:S4 domain-containing protein [Candidatus Paceibacterota bacterium]
MQGEDIKAEGGKEDFPMRLNRFLALKGVASRREADAIIEKKQVAINGRMAGLGAKVNLGDTITLLKGGKGPAEFSYIAYYKPAGVFLDTTSKEWNKSEFARLKPKVWPADLLEKDAEGLVILTNDKRLSRLLNEPEKIERVYVVRTQEDVAPTFLNKLESGIEIGGRLLKARATEPFGERIFSISIAATRKDVEQMCETLRRTVKSIKRERIASLSLKGLQPGAHKKIADKELESFLKKTGLAA